MSNTNQQKDDQLWKDMADELRDALRLRPLTPKEAEAEYEAADEESLTEAEIERFLDTARAAVPREKSYAERIKRPSEEQTLEEEVGEVIGLNRNGDGDGDGFDPDVEEEMRRQREAAEQKEHEDGRGDDEID